MLPGVDGDGQDIIDASGAQAPCSEFGTNEGLAVTQNTQASFGQAPCCKDDWQKRGGGLQRSKKGPQVAHRVSQSVGDGRGVLEINAGLPERWRTHLHGACRSALRFADRTWTRARDDSERQSQKMRDTRNIPRKVPVGKIDVSGC